jgi:hypothetical protein
MMKKLIAKLLVMFMMVGIVCFFNSSVGLMNVSFAENSIAGSDLVTSETNGVITVHAYDDFNGNTINTDLWEETDDFDISSNKLENNGGKDKIKLKGSYKDYDAYSISVELVGLGAQNWYLSNGGFGISGQKTISSSTSQDVIWAFHELMNKVSYRRKYYRSLNITDYASVSQTNRVGDSLIPAIKLDGNRNWNESWANRSIRIEMEADMNAERTGYNCSISVYEYTNRWKLKSSVSHYFDKNTLDFNDIFLTAPAAHNNWYIMFDNFEFQARKNVKFDSLEASWENDSYKLTWDEVEDASKYTVYYDVAGSDVKYTDLLAGETTSVFVSDTDARSKYKYKVVATVGDSTLTSNQVYIAGNISDAFEISGAFVDDDYAVSWAKLDIDDNPTFTYSLFYGDSEGTVNTLVEGGETLTSDTLMFTINQIQSSDKYYGKFLELVANVDYGSYGQTKFYSNALQIKSGVKLSLSHAVNQYIFNWETNLLYSSYYLHKNEIEANLSDPVALAPNPDIFVKNDAVDGEISFKIDDTNSAYINKYFVLGGNDRGDIDYSNIVYTESGVVVPTLSWEKSNEGQQVYTWEALAGASQVKLYYGERASEIDMLISDDASMLTTNRFETIKADYENKYVQLRFFKDDIWYYSNIVRTQSFNLTNAEITKDASDSTKKKLTIDWQDIKWVEDGSDDTSRVSYYEVYYNENGVRNTIATNLKDSNYTIMDIYSTNKDYLGKDIYIESICPVTDGFEITQKLSIKSPVIVPRHIEFNTLIGNFDDERNYTVSWQTPLELNVDAQNLMVDRYEVFYGVSEELITTSDAIFEAPYSNLEKRYEQVTIDGTGSVYYHKFFKIEAEINNVLYSSNIGYSEDRLELAVNRFEDDFTLVWSDIENASEIKVYYSDTLEGEYKLYEAANLSGNAKDYTIEDLDDVNKTYNNKYFKVGALFDTYEISSNSVLIDVKKALPSLEGKFQEDGSYDLTWQVIDWANDGYQLYYEETKTENDVTNTTNVPIDARTYAKSVIEDSVADVANSEYKEKYVRIVAIDGPMRAFSNAVLIVDPTLEGQLEGAFAGENVGLNIGNRASVVYNFKVFKEMKQPYIKIELNGSKYLSYDKITANLQKIKSTSSEKIPLRLVTEVDATNGNTTLYAHILNENKSLEVESGVAYKLYVTSNVIVNKKNENDVYAALKAHDESLMNWSLPYNIADLKVDDVPLDDDMYIRYEAYWNIDDTVSSGDERHTSIELFKIDLKVENRKMLPGSR